MGPLCPNADPYGSVGSARRPPMTVRRSRLWPPPGLDCCATIGAVGRRAAAGTVLAVWAGASGSLVARSAWGRERRGCLWPGPRRRRSTALWTTPA